MSPSPVAHETIVVERTYPHPPARVFAAWADPDSKRRWAVCHAEHEMDFRPGGVERARGAAPDGPAFETEIRYHDIVPGRRIVYAYALRVDGAASAVAVVTAEFRAEGAGTRLVVTEQGAYLDGPDGAERLGAGLRDALERLAAALHAPVAA